MTTMTLRGVRKTFGRTVALADADLDLRSGEIIGVAGPNGAGKSTLTKVLAGELRCDEGTFLVDGDPWDPSRRDGLVALVHQEPQLWPNLTVEENLLVGREGWTVGAARSTEKDRATVASLGLLPWFAEPLERCALAVQQRVEIGRAMVRDARCYIFDEPNSALTEQESSTLFDFLHQLATDGAVVLLISHRLQELVAHCARVCVVRDGVVARTLAGEELTEQAIAAELVVGRPVAGSGPAAAGPRTAGPIAGDIALRVDSWTSEHGLFRNVELTLVQGEITAFVGVEGSGARELVASLAGFSPANGRSSGNAAAGADKNVVTYLPADRKGMLFHNMTVGENLVVRLGSPDIASRGAGRLKRARVSTRARVAIERFGIRTSGSGQPVSSLSGGNQQKVAIAAALASRPALLVVQEPTRGVDIGSKADIYRTLREAAAEGVAVAVYCTEIPEAFELSDRVVVADRGRVVLDVRTSSFADVTAMAEAVATMERVSVHDVDHRDVQRERGGRP